MWSALLEDTAGTTNTGAGNDWFLWIFIGVIVVAFIVYLFFSGRKNKARQQEYVEQLEAIRPGHKVKTAGGICGIVVEVCDDNTVIIETGSEHHGKSYVKTDAKGPTQIAREEAEAKRKAEKEAKEAAKRGEGAPAAEAPAQEQPAQEEAPASEEENKEEK